MIRILFDKATLAVTHVFPYDGAVTAFPPDLGLVQGDVEVVIKACIGSGIGLGPIFEFLTHNNIHISMSPELQKVLRDKAFGQQLMNEFLSLRKAENSTPEEDLALMEYSSLGDVRELLYEGAIRSAKTRLEEKSDSVMSADSKSHFVTKMSDYLHANG